MKNIWTISLLLACGVCFGQNLVPNGDFETYVNCPTGHSIACIGFNDILRSSTVNWRNVGCGSADYYNVCNNLIGGEVGVPFSAYAYKYPRSGVGQIGLHAQVSPGGFYCEYAGTYLTCPLVANQTYYVEFYVNLDGHYYGIGSDLLGALFTVGLPDTANFAYQGLLPYTAQVNNPDGYFITDTLNWTKISGTFVASGGEDFITLGNFKDTAVSHGYGYYFIDDVEVTTDSVTCNTVGIKKPRQTTTTISPNPFSVQLAFSLADNEQTTVTLYNFLGQQVLQQTFTNSTTINTAQLADGIYFYEQRNSKGTLKTGKVVKQ